MADEELAANPKLSQDQDVFTLFKEGITYLMQKAKESLDSPSDLVRFLRYPSAPIQEGPLVFLGSQYNSSIDLAFLEDFQTRIWITYRSDFPAVKAHSYTTDSGWGCMLRSGQMLLASAFIMKEMGRKWRLGMIENGDWLKYADIVTRFADSPTAPYSIHRIALQGVQFDKQVGSWFGPSTISQVLKVLNHNDRNASLFIHLSQDGVLYTNSVLKDLKDRNGNDRAVLLLIPIMLGLDSLTPVYHPLVKKCFDIKQCVGIAGGRPNSSLFFSGYQGDNLIYYDPHFCRPAIPLREIHSYQKTDLFSYHCEKVRYLRVSSMDPSMVVGFLVESAADFEKLVIAFNDITLNKTPLFSVALDPPDYHGQSDTLLSEDEQDDNSS